jgi:tetratricopeptide (TPR) repeat protein
MRRKQVSEDDFLSSPSESANFPHIRPITPPLSPALSSASASPLSHVDGHNAEGTTPTSSTDVAGAEIHRINHVPLPNLMVDASRHLSYGQAHGWRVDQHQVTTVHRDSFSSSLGESDGHQMHAPPFSRRSECLPRERRSSPLSATTNEILLYGSQRMAIQTFALDRQIPCQDVELYRSVARSASPSCVEISDLDDDLSSIDLTRTLSDFDEDIYDEQDRKSLMHVPGHTDFISTRLKSFKPDVDEARAFRWASRYFLACILQGRRKITLANAARLSATKIFERMLESETRSPYVFPRQAYVPSNRSRFILSGLSLMTTVLNAHGRVDMLRKFLLDSRSSIEKFFRMEDHPLSAPYSYLLSLMDNDDHPIDDELWERNLSSAHTIIRQVWNGGPNAVVSHYYWAWHILKRKRYAQAIEQLKLCYEKALEMFGDCHIITINCLSTIARALFEQGMYHDARTWLVDTIRRSREALGPEHPFCYKLIDRVGDLDLQLGDLASAEAIFRDVVEGRKKSLGLHHGHTSDVVHKLADLLIRQGRRAESDKLIKELDEEYEEQQNQYWEERGNYFPDSRQKGFTHPSLNIRTLIKLH